MKPKLFFTYKALMKPLLQDLYPVPSNWTGTSIIPGLSEGCTYRTPFVSFPDVTDPSDVDATASTAITTKLFDEQKKKRNRDANEDEQR